MRAIVLALALEALAVSGKPPSPLLAAHAGSAAEAVAAARGTGGNGVRRVWEMRVVSTGRADNSLYLNSEQDYRDPQNLTIRLRPSCFASLKARYGDPPEDVLKGKLLRVEGFARQVPIVFLEHGVRTGRGYYQTQIEVRAADQIAVVAEPSDH